MPQSPADPPFTPLTEETVASTFSYLRAVQADAQTAAKLVTAEPRMSALLAGIAEGIVVAAPLCPARTTTRRHGTPSPWRPSGTSS